MKNIKRNGDWGFVETTENFKGEKVKHNGSFVFAEGEATGHLHIVKVPNLEDMTITKLPDGSYLVDLRKEATVTHPEHSEKVDLIVPAGKYLLGQRREKDWFSLTVRRVID